MCRCSHILHVREHQCVDKIFYCSSTFLKTCTFHNQTNKQHKQKKLTTPTILRHPLVSDFRTQQTPHLSRTEAQTCDITAEYLLSFLWYKKMKYVSVCLTVYFSSHSQMQGLINKGSKYPGIIFTVSAKPRWQALERRSISHFLHCKSAKQQLGRQQPNASKLQYFLIKR